MTHRPSDDAKTKRAASIIAWVSILAILGLATLPAHARTVPGDQPPPPCHPNPRAKQDMKTVANRGDIQNLPAALKDRLVQLAGRPHSVLPLQVFNEADPPSQLFQYYLLDTTGFEPNVFTTLIPGVNDQVELSVTGGNCGQPTIGTVRLVLEPKPGLPTDPNDPNAFIDVFTDIDPLFVINNESGWYEGWMIHDLTVPNIAPPRSEGTGAASFGTITAADAAALAAMGTGNNVPGNVFTMDGQAVRLPSVTDHFPDVQTNVVPLQVSMGAYNAMQQADVHAYWEFNYQGTNWVHPLYELPFTGGFPDDFGQAPDTFEDGEIGLLQSIVPGSGPSGIKNMANVVGDNPNLPRDPDKFDSDTNDAQREFRQRGIPSGLANEVFLDVYERPASFEPSNTNLQQRLFDAYAAEVFQDNTRLFLTPPAFNRFAVTREINDGLLAPRFAPSQRAWILTGTRVPVSPAVPASTGRDADDR